MVCKVTQLVIEHHPCYEQIAPCEHAPSSPVLRTYLQLGSYIIQMWFVRLAVYGYVTFVSWLYATEAWPNVIYVAV